MILAGTTLNLLPIRRRPLVIASAASGGPGVAGDCISSIWPYVRV